MSAPEAGRCPPVDVLVAFRDSTLDREGAQEVTSHVSRCARCRLAIEQADEVERDYDAEIAASHSGQRWWLALVASLAAAAILSPLVFRRSRSGDDAIHRLAAAMPATARTVEPRLSGGFAWAPLHRVRRSFPAEKSAEELIAGGAAGKVLRETVGRKSADARHAAGVAYVVAGQSNVAISLLEEAVHLSPRDARVWNDLAAALYCDASLRDDQDGLSRALSAADTAIALDASLHEAAFNRALILDRMGKRREAAAAWKAYLARDGVGGWAAEAKARLADAARKEAALP